MLRTLSSVRFARLHPSGIRILSALSDVSERFNIDYTITCGSEGHKSEDPHTLGKAFDVRTKDLSDVELRNLMSEMRAHLGPGFTVLYEVRSTAGLSFARAGLVSLVNPKASAEHLHVQVKKGSNDSD